jgi:3-deoxy-manno-octulosonate cytidylyltransferase (CMP-KDO synthetase)
MNSLILIPARLGATRLPNKPLADIHGKPMIVHVWQRAVAANVGDVFVATPDEEIANAVAKAGAKVVMTSINHPSGTDRIFEAMNIIDSNKQYDLIINVQGDLPDIDSKTIKESLDALIKGGADIATPVVEITDETEINNPNVVKAVVNWHSAGNTGIAATFTRNPKPASDGKFYYHIGLYVYKRAAIEKFTQLLQSENEKREKLEQLRALDNGMRIDVAKVAQIPISVDTIEDLEKARRVIKND